MAAQSRSGARPRAAPADSPPRSKKAGKGRARGDRDDTAGYHHGNLRQALLAATESLLTERGLEQFTLREVARRAGVSHGAPAHHFGDVRGLLSAFTAGSYEGLGASMSRRRAQAPAQAFDQLVAAGVGYVDFALSHRARFQLMFRSERLDAKHPALQQAASAAYGQLVECIEAFSAGSRASSAPVQARIALAWSVVHGFATLMIDNAGFAATVAHGNRGAALKMVRTMLALTRPAFEPPAQ